MTGRAVVVRRRSLRGARTAVAAGSPPVLIRRDSSPGSERPPTRRRPRGRSPRQGVLGDDQIEMKITAHCELTSMSTGAPASTGPRRRGPDTESVVALGVVGESEVSPDHSTRGHLDTVRSQQDHTVTGRGDELEVVGDEHDGGPPVAELVQPEPTSALEDQVPTDSTSSTSSRSLGRAVATLKTSRAITAGSGTHRPVDRMVCESSTSSTTSATSDRRRPEPRPGPRHSPAGQSGFTTTPSWMHANVREASDRTRGRSRPCNLRSIGSDDADALAPLDVGRSRQNPAIGVRWGCGRSWTVLDEHCGRTTRLQPGHRSRHT